MSRPGHEPVAGKAEAVAVLADLHLAMALELRGEITFANEAMARTLGRRVDQLVGRPAHDVCGHPEPAGSTCPICEALSAGDSIPCTGTTFRRADGTAFPVEFTSVRVLDRGRANGARRVSPRRQS